MENDAMNVTVEEQQYQRDLQGLRDERDALLARRDELIHLSGQEARRRDSIARSVANLTAGEVALSREPWLAREKRRTTDERQTSWMIRRAWGGEAGPFADRQTAAHYLQPGDELFALNEHGNVIDYDPQFDETDESGDDPTCREWTP